MVKASYYDIISRIGDPPIWFDEHGVPRYCEFAPQRSASIYVNEVALAEIACQGCGRVFHVAFSGVNVQSGTIAEAIEAKSLHYGDPPNIECCAAGPTENSIPRRVLEYWHRCFDERYVENDRRLGIRVVKNPVAYFEWIRDRTLEVDICPGWARD
jgi:hypothetical protein